MLPVREKVNNLTILSQQNKNYQQNNRLLKKEKKKTVYENEIENHYSF